MGLGAAYPPASAMATGERVEALGGMVPGRKKREFTVPGEIGQAIIGPSILKTNRWNGTRVEARSVPEAVRVPEEKCRKCCAPATAGMI